MPFKGAHTATRILPKYMTNLLSFLWKVAYVHHTQPVSQGFLAMDPSTSINNHDDSSQTWTQTSLDLSYLSIENHSSQVTLGYVNLTIERKTHIFEYTLSNNQRHKICLTYFYISKRIFTQQWLIEKT